MTEELEEGKMPTWCSGEEWCPLTATASIVSKKWHPVIIHRLLSQGGMGFNQLKDEVGGISSKVLSESLEDLEEKRIVNREVVSEKPFRVKYQLTERGRKLESAIQEMINWGEENLCEASKKEEAIV
ncbi:winged helix-turn-helix transcriptional regulator [Candidatus Nanosalina sp. VS9-1]|uniref:winged helix-turn-helix transcriptional regulator n=1 Tax=Candidatus Nanosalina sp. VS9-1 TaxID=3388566 RepID=UPI0039E00CDC